MGPQILSTVKVLLLAHAMQGSVVGTVWDAGTNEPVAGAVVTMTDPHRVAVADDKGRYEFSDVPPGQHEITVSFIGYARRTLSALVPERRQVEINVWLETEPVPMKPLDVRAPIIVRGLEPGDVAAFPDREISASALRNHPLLAEPDALEALGGGVVAMGPEDPSGVNIRGGSSDQTAYFLDGIPVFNPYHAAGLASGWNADALSRVSLTSVAPWQADPNTLSGAVEGSTRAPGEGVAGRGSVSTTQSRMTLDGTLRPVGLGYLVSLRSGLPDVIAPKGEYSYIKGETGDWLGKLEAPALGGHAEILGYGNENELNTAATVAPDGATPSAQRNGFEWSSRSIGAQWKRVFSGAAVRVVGWRADGDAGSRWASEGGLLDMAARRRDRGVTVTMQHDAPRAVTSAEFRFERLRTSYRVVSDSASGPEWSLAANAPVTTALARHGRTLGPLRVNVAAALAVTGGKSYAAPSTQVVWNASERLKLSGSYGRTHQFAQSLRNAESVVGNVFPADLAVGAGAPGVPVARSRLGVLAATYVPAPPLRLSMQAYDRRSDGLLLVAPDEGGPFATGSFVVGSGTSRGASAEASWSVKRCGVVASYGFQRVRLEYGNSSYVPESGAAHLLEGGVIVFPSPTASVRLGFTAAMGRRATSVAGGFEWESSNLLDRGSEFAGSPSTAGEPLGATALPDYYRLDLGVRKEWSTGIWGREATVALFATATNLLGRKNIMTYAKDASTGEPVGVEMRPLAPLVVGLDWGF